MKLRRGKGRAQVWSCGVPGGSWVGVATVDHTLMLLVLLIGMVISGERHSHSPDSNVVGGARGGRARNK